MPLAAQFVDVADYRRHLQLLVRWREMLQEVLVEFDDGPQDASVLPPSGTLQLMRLDLAAAHAGAAGADVGWDGTRAGMQTPARRVQSAAFRWGIAYVVAGSQLGAAVLFRRFAASLAPHPLHYLRHSAAASTWPAFLQQLGAHVTTRRQIDDACDGAKFAFDCLLELLAGTEALPAAKAL